MQVVILAGGKGTRLRPLTNRIPKPLISISGKPFLQHQLELIKSFGINEVLILVGYLGRKIKEYFGNGSDFGLRIRYSEEKNLLGTGGALRNAGNKLTKEFLLLNGDTFLPVDYRELINCFHQQNRIGVITIYDNQEKIGLPNILLGKNNIVLGYDKKNPGRMTHLDAGAMVFKKQVLDFIPQGKTCSLEEEIFPRLIKAKELVAFPTSQRFYDTGTPQGLKEIRRILKC